MRTYQEVEKVVLDSGLWDQGRRYKKHGFTLSPDAYAITPGRRDELDRLGTALHECLAGWSRIAAIAHQPRLGSNKTWGMIRKALSLGVPAVYDQLTAVQPGRVPAICKVDLMVTQDGRYRIAEIDGHNKHGLGYSTLAARVRKLVQPAGSYAFPGVAAAIAQEVKNRQSESATLLYADQERFYLPEFSILGDELAKHGVKLAVISELQFQLGQVRLLVDLPFLYKRPDISLELAQRYQQSQVDFLIPPKPFFGSKVLLGLMRNEERRPELEAILHSQIPARCLELLRTYLPETYLVQKRGSNGYWASVIGQRRFVLKESISSGMKGIVFSDDSKFAATMKLAASSYYRFILQEEVENRSLCFDYFDEEGARQRGHWYVRITAHYSVCRVADLVVTARQDKKVHGAPDSLQLGAYIDDGDVRS